MTVAIGVVVLLLILFVIAGVATGIGSMLHEADDLDRFDPNTALQTEVTKVLQD